MAAPIIYYYRLVQLTDKHLTTRPLRDHIGCLRVPGQNQNSDRYDVEIDPINNLRAKSPSSPNQYGMSHPKWILIPNGSFAGIENLIDIVFPSFKMDAWSTTKRLLLVSVIVLRKPI
jgi:hypothetical protein